ncbi:hypothetical protein KDC22_10550 [Paenibacillus tritici]|uniref:hypothetical protein n=1 Tax=Paenibacillus tritici TaxID=1873425 RepID=UPI001BA910A6|nr:hypothetical protein [Paenibacillus tritici]QUL56871.1 hypothetical protein KDC22_10550 [Paenibacillus tritici]
MRYSDVKKRHQFNWELLFFNTINFGYPKPLFNVLSDLTATEPFSVRFFCCRGNYIIRLLWIRSVGKMHAKTNMSFKAQLQHEMSSAPKKERRLFIYLTNFNGKPNTIRL